MKHVRSEGSQQTLSSSADTAAVLKRILLSVAVVAAVALLTYLTMDYIAATFLTVVVAVVALVLVTASDWDQHSTFEEREMRRARKRAAKRERTAGARARDREHWEAHQAKKAARQEG